jgi:hypothetical protein
VRRLAIDFPHREAVDACAEHARAQELAPLIAHGACRLDDLVELDGNVVRLGHGRMVCRLVQNDGDEARDPRTRRRHLPPLPEGRFGISGRFERSREGQCTSRGTAAGCAGSRSAATISPCPQSKLGSL